LIRAFFWPSRVRGKSPERDQAFTIHFRPHGRFFIACHLPPPPERSGKEIRMSRINKKHARNIQRQRRNKGPEMLSQAADNQLKDKAREIVTALYQATMDSNPAAASVLVGLAESAEYPESAAVVRQACSIVEKWAREPQVAMLDTDLRLGDKQKQLLLTNGAADGKRSDNGASPGGAEQILDAEIG
jgi:hypothetical protein